MKPADDRSADAVADDMIASLTPVAATIQTMPMPALRSPLTALIGRLEVDMATKAVQIDLQIPAGGAKNGQRPYRARPEPGASERVDPRA